MANLNETPTDNAPDEPLVPLPADEPEATVEPEATSEPAAPVPSDTPPSDTPSEPAVAPTAAEPQAPDPAIVAREQALTQREQAAAAQQAEFERTRAAAQVENDLRTRTAELERTGMEPAQVSAIVERERGLRMEVLQARQSAQQEAQTLRGQHAAALHFSNQYGIPFNDIASMATPQEMEAAGRSFAANKTSDDKITKLEAEVAGLKQDKVPAGQTFDDGGGGTPEGRDRKSRMQYLNDKEGSFTDAEWDELGKHLANPPAR